MTAARKGTAVKHSPPDRIVVTWCAQCGATHGVYQSKPYGAPMFMCSVCRVPLTCVRYRRAAR